MLWLAYVFYGLMVAIGVAGFVLLLRAKQARAWIWLGVALVGAVGIAGVAAGRVEGRWRALALVATFTLFAADHLAQYVQSMRTGAPRKIQLALAVWWFLLGLLTLL